MKKIKAILNFLKFLIFMWLGIFLFLFFFAVFGSGILSGDESEAQEMRIIISRVGFISLVIAAVSCGVIKIVDLLKRKPKNS